MSVHVIEAKFLLLEVCTTTLSPSIWHIKSVHINEDKVLLRKFHYYIKSQYLTPSCQYTWLRQSFHCWRSVLPHWVPVSDTWLRQSFYCERSTTTLRPSTWHHDVSTYDCGKVSTAWGLYYYIESQYLTHEVSTHPWGQASSAKGKYNYIVSKYLTHEVSTHHWDQDYTARDQ